MYSTTGARSVGRETYHVPVAGLVGVDGFSLGSAISTSFSSPSVTAKSTSALGIVFIKIALIRRTCMMESAFTCAACAAGAMLRGTLHWPVLGRRTNIFLHLRCPLPRQLQQILEPRAAKCHTHKYDKSLVQSALCAQSSDLPQGSECNRFGLFLFGEKLASCRNNVSRKTCSDLVLLEMK